MRPQAGGVPGKITKHHLLKKSADSYTFSISGPSNLVNVSGFGISVPLKMMNVSSFGISVPLKIVNVSLLFELPLFGIPPPGSRRPHRDSNADGMPE